MKEGKLKRKDHTSCYTWSSIFRTLFSCGVMSKTSSRMVNQQNMPDIIPDMTSNELSTASDKSCAEAISKMRSVHSFSTRDEYLYAMKEDLANWLKHMYSVDIHAENFFEVLENGALLCQHANNVMDAIRKWRDNRIGITSGTINKRNGGSSQISDVGLLYNIVYRAEAKPQSFAARDNVSNFIDWARNNVGVRECLMFETDDLILRKNERNFIFCLLEIARYGSKYGVDVPRLVRFEEDIAREIKNEHEQEFKSLTLLKQLHNDNPTSWISKAIQTLRQPVAAANVEDTKEKHDYNSEHENIMDDEIYREVTLLSSQCTCCPKFSVIPLGPGKFRMGPSLQLVFVRKLNDHLMVNVGQKWDTLQNYMNELDPCRRHNVGDSTENGKTVPEDKTADISTYDLDTDSLNESADVSFPVPGELDDETIHLENSQTDKPCFSLDDSTVVSYRRPMHKYVKAKTTQLTGLSTPRVFVTDYEEAVEQGDLVKPVTDLSTVDHNGIDGLPLNSSSDSLNDGSSPMFKARGSIGRIMTRGSRTPSRIPRLSAKDLSGRPVPRRLVLNYRRSRSMRSDESLCSLDKEFGSEKPSRVPKPVRCKYVDSGRSYTDCVGQASPIIVSPFENGNNSQESCSTANLTSRSAGSAEAAFRENRAYRWRKKALLFRNYMQETTPRDERAVFTGDLLNHHFHYPDLRGSEIIYGPNVPASPRQTKAGSSRRRSASGEQKSILNRDSNSLVNLQTSRLI